MLPSGTAFGCGVMEYPSGVTTVAQIDQSLIDGTPEVGFVGVCASRRWLVDVSPVGGKELCHWIDSSFAIHLAAGGHRKLVYPCSDVGCNEIFRS